MKYRLDPFVDRYMKENDCDETEAANDLGLNYDEIWDEIDDQKDLDEA